MSDTSDVLNDVVKVLKAGEEFYREGVEKTEKAPLKAVYAEMADVRQNAIAALSARIKADGGDISSGSWAEKSYAFYTSMKAALGDKEDVMLADLEEHEDRTLEAFRDAMEDADDAETKQVLLQHYPKFQQTHDRMKALKEARDAA